MFAPLARPCTSVDMGADAAFGSSGRGMLRRRSHLLGRPSLTPFTSPFVPPRACCARGQPPARPPSDQEYRLNDHEIVLLRRAARFVSRSAPQVTRGRRAAGVVEAPAWEVFAQLCAVGPAGAHWIGTAGRPAMPPAGGPLRYEAPLDDGDSTSVMVEVDPIRRLFAVEGVHGSRREYVVLDDPRGSRLEYAVLKAGNGHAPAGRIRRPFRRDDTERVAGSPAAHVDDLLARLAARLDCAAYREAD
jgi:hypothetical protein